MTWQAAAHRSSAPAIGIDRELLRASLARTPRERFERAVQLARFSSTLRQARWVFSHCRVSGFDPLRILHAFDAAGVQYIPIGGFAANVHGYERATVDLDIWYERSRGNVQRLVSVLRQLEARPCN